MATLPSGAPTQWQPTIPVPQSISDATTNQLAPLGTRLEVGERVYYYAHAGTSANVGAGRVVCSTAPVASHQADILVPAVTSAGAKVITVTLGASVANNEYAEGYMIVSSGTGSGMSYRVKSHGSFGTAATDWSIVLYDPIKEPMTATTELNFIPNMYTSVKIASELLDLAVGVTSTPATTGEFLWLQTWGPCAVLNTAAVLAAGAIARMGTLGGVAINVDGTTAGSNVQNLVGKNFNLAGTADEDTPIFLTIRA